MTYTPKSWVNYPGTSTPLNAASLAALEQRVASYVSSDDMGPPAAHDLAMSDLPSHCTLCDDRGRAGACIGARRLC